MKNKFSTKVYHIIFDGFGCERKILNDEKFILKLLLGITDLIKMKILAGPNIVRDYNKKTPGISAFEIVNFSHISVHTFPKTREIYIDIFSCRPFNYEKVKKYLYVKLKLKPNQVETLEIKYPWEK